MLIFRTFYLTNKKKYHGFHKNNLFSTASENSVLKYIHKKTVIAFYNIIDFTVFVNAAFVSITDKKINF